MAISEFAIDNSQRTSCNDSTAGEDILNDAFLQIPKIYEMTVFFLCANFLMAFSYSPCDLSIEKGHLWITFITSASVEADMKRERNPCCLNSAEVVPQMRLPSCWQAQRLCDTETLKKPSRVFGTSNRLSYVYLLLSFNCAIYAEVIHILGGWGGQVM